MHPYVTGLQEAFSPHANPAEAAPMKAYLRGQFEFLGIKTPRRRELLKAYIAAHGLPPVESLSSVVKDLWALPEREYQYAALGLASRWLKKLPPDFLETIEFLVVTKSWWDTVDGIASDMVGGMFKAHPEACRAYLDGWRQSDNFWLRRTCILFQLGYKKTTDFPLLCAIIQENLGSKEFFINKAIGWALREYAKTDASAVRDFVTQTPLHPLSVREALKHQPKGGDPLE